MTLYGEMALRKYLFDDSTMERVQVWFDVFKVIEGTREEDGKSVHFSSHSPAGKIFLGECDATPEAVAELAGVHVAEAAEVLNWIGTGLGVIRRPYEEGYMLFYLVVFPSGKERPYFTLYFRLV